MLNGATAQTPATPSGLRAGLYAPSAADLTALVDRAADKLREALGDPQAVIDTDRLSAYLAMIGIEVGEQRHAAAAEKRAGEQKLREAREQIEQLRRELAIGRAA